QVPFELRHTTLRIDAPLGFELEHVLLSETPRTYKPSKLVSRAAATRWIEIVESIATPISIVVAVFRIDVFLVIGPILGRKRRGLGLRIKQDRVSHITESHPSIAMGRCSLPDNFVPEIFRSPDCVHYH